MSAIRHYAYPSYLMAAHSATTVRSSLRLLVFGLVQAIRLRSRNSEICKTGNRPYLRGLERPISVCTRMASLEPIVGLEGRARTSHDFSAAFCTTVSSSLRPAMFDP